VSSEDLVENRLVRRATWEAPGPGRPRGTSAAGTSPRRCLPRRVCRRLFAPQITPRSATGW